ncbi:MAG: hypothetical protein D3916_00410 [Candidatus Electrothrix sp. MAN1_4]|nr:hypothetical protein [Candidatus Electrothrix sp. MAN1_4]
MTDQEFAEIFLREYEEIEKSCATGGQAMLYLDTLVNNDPHHALELLTTIIEHCTKNKQLAFIASGPLENIFVYHGYKILQNIKDKADNSEKFQLAVSGV